MKSIRCAHSKYNGLRPTGLRPFACDCRTIGLWPANAATALDRFVACLLLFTVELRHGATPLLLCLSPIQVLDLPSRPLFAFGLLRLCLFVPILVQVPPHMF